MLEAQLAALHLAGGTPALGQLRWANRRVCSDSPSGSRSGGRAIVKPPRAMPRFRRSLLRPEAMAAVLAELNSTHLERRDEWTLQLGQMASGLRALEAQQNRIMQEIQGMRLPRAKVRVGESVLGGLRAPPLVFVEPDLEEAESTFLSDPPCNQFALAPSSDGDGFSTPPMLRPSGRFSRVGSSPSHSSPDQVAFRPTCVTPPRLRNPARPTSVQRGVGLSLEGMRRI